MEDKIFGHSNSIYIVYCLLIWYIFRKIPKFLCSYNGWQMSQVVSVYSASEDESETFFTFFEE